MFVRIIMNESLARKILFFLVVLFLTFQFYLLNTESVWSDESLYAWYALQMNQDIGNLFSPMVWAFHPPLFALIASFFVNFLTPLESVRAVSVALGAGTMVLTYHVGRKMGGHLIGVGAAALTGFHAAFILYSHLGLLETGLMAGTVLTVLGVIKYGENQNPWPLAAGIIFSLLIKRGGLFAVPLGIAGVLAYMRLERKKMGVNWNDTRLWAAVAAVGTAFIFALQFVRERDFEFLEDFIRNGFSHAIPFIWPIAVLVPFFLFGFFFIWKEKKGLAGLLVIWIGLFFGIVFYERANFRYFLPALPAIAIGSACGIQKLAQLFSKSEKMQTLFVGFLLLIVITPSAVGGIRSLAGSPFLTGFQEEGAWLKEHAQGAWIYDYKERETRLFSGIDEYRYGGRIRPYPATPQLFLEEVATLKKPVYAITMDWLNPFVPGYAYAKDSFLLENGFVEVKSVVRPVNGTSRKVIRIYSNAIDSES